MAGSKPVGRAHSAARWWLALVEVGRPEGGILFADEVEGAFAWAAAEAPDRSAAEAMIRRLFAKDRLALVRFENVFPAAIGDIENADGLLAAQVAVATDLPRCARGALSFFAAEGQA